MAWHYEVFSPEGDLVYRGDAHRIPDIALRLVQEGPALFQRDIAACWDLIRLDTYEGYEIVRTPYDARAVDHLMGRILTEARIPQEE